MKKSILKTATFFLVWTLVAFSPLQNKVEAIGFGDIFGGGGSIFSSVLDAGLAYTQMKQERNYLDNEGRGEFLDALQKENGVNADPEANELLRKIVDNLSGTIAVSEPAITQKPFLYFVNNKTTLNAACGLGHVMMVNGGTFPILNYNEDKIAFLVAHEMGHGQRNHALSAPDKVFPIRLLATILANKTNTSIYSAQMTNMFMKYSVVKGVNIPAEWEADNFAWDMAVRAGYNPGEGVALWQKVKEKYGNQGQNFLGELISPSDHPTQSQRIANYEKKLTEYSKNNITVIDNKVLVKGQSLVEVTATETQSAKERTYIIAGLVAKAYHDLPEMTAAYEEDGAVKVGSMIIVPANAGISYASEIVSIFNALNGLSPNAGQGTDF
jgi:predicted Zn-dependent protease